MLDYKKDARKRVAWKIDGYYVDSCNCDWGCPCQFMARPTHGGCEGLGGVLIRKGNYGQSVSLDNLLVAFAFSYPAAIHEGHGKAFYYVDERADEDQFQALSKIVSGEAGGGPFEIYASTCDNFEEPRRARIRVDAAGLTSRITVEDVGEVEFEPIRNPVTREPHRAIIELPAGFFEASRMEQASSKRLAVHDRFLKFSYHDTYGSVSEVSWSGP